MLGFTVSLDDVKAAILDFPPQLRRIERAVLKPSWRRWAIRSIDGFVLVLLCSLFLLHLTVSWAVASAAGITGAFALVQWSRLDHLIKRGLPVAVEKEARKILASRSDQRRVWADATGLTIADAVITQQIPWAQVQLVETHRHVIVGTEAISTAIPRHVGQPVLAFLKFARSCGVG
jgi:drug/metabolite transporter superfamily protein YnfA